tara:strand:+ start:48936 stop:49202 length:267 start_codon:yes stop_codon:yes gene_type:complete
MKVIIEKVADQRMSRENNPYSIQEIFVFLNGENNQPHRAEIFPPRDKPAGFSPGTYDFDPQKCLSVGRNGRLEVGEIQLSLLGSQKGQ